MDIPPPTETPILSNEVPAVSSNPEPKPKSKIIFITITLFCILLLIGIGTFAFALLSSGKTPPEPTKTTVLETPTPTPAPTFDLKISGLEDGAIVATKSAHLTGNTGVPAVVAITGGTDDQIIESTGTFSADISLTPGENQITLTADDNKGNQKNQKYTIFYQENN